MNFNFFLLIPLTKRLLTFHFFFSIDPGWVWRNER